MDPILFFNEHPFYISLFIHSYYIIFATSIATTILIYTNLNIITKANEQEQFIHLKRIAIINILLICVIQTFILVIEFSNKSSEICDHLHCSNVITVSAIVISLSALLPLLHTNIHGKFSKNNKEDIKHSTLYLFTTCYLLLPLIFYLLAYFVGIDIAIQRFYSYSTLIIVIYNVISNISNTSVENLSKNENIIAVELSRRKSHCATIVLILLYLGALEVNIQERKLHQSISCSFFLTTVLVSTTGCIYLSLIKRLTPRSVLLQL